MNLTEATFIIPYLVSLALSIGVTVYTWNRRNIRGAQAFAWFTLGQCLWIMSYIFEILSPDLRGKIFWNGFEWLAITLIVLAIPVFAVKYTELETSRPRVLFALTLVIPLIMLGLVSTDGFHHLVYSNPHPTGGPGFHELDHDLTVPIAIYSFYSLLAVAGSLILLARQFIRPHQLYRTQTAIIALGIVIPLTGMILTMVGARLASQQDIVPFTFISGELLIAWGLSQFRVFEILPVGRDKIFEAMVEPVVILDNQHRIVDINTSMLDLLGQKAADVIGEPAKKVFDDFPIPIKLYTHVSYARAEATFQVRGKNVYYEMTVWPLYDSNRRMTGRIYISHDITALKELERELRALNHNLEDRVHARTRELAEAYDTTLEGWARALELRDKETEGHSRRVTEITLLLARALEMTEDEIVHLRRGAILHDIGKMAIPDEILRKKGGLTPEERAIIEQHPETAYKLLAQISFLQKALEIPHCHHEKWDGSGYPRGLKGRDIPLGARIFTVADVWDALSFDRSYNQAWPREKIIAYFVGQSGRLFDPHVVDEFLKMVERGGI